MSEATHDHHDNSSPQRGDSGQDAEVFARSQGVQVALDILDDARSKDDALRNYGGKPFTQRYAVRVEIGSREYTEDHPFAYDSVHMRPKRKSMGDLGPNQAVILRFALAKDQPWDALEPNGQVVITYQRTGETDQTFLLNDLDYVKIDSPDQYSVVRTWDYEELQGSRDQAESGDDFNIEEFRDILGHFEPTPHLPHFLDSADKAS